MTESVNDSNGHQVSPEDVEHELRRAGVSSVLTGEAHRAQYSSDASLYRLVPTAVVLPRDAEEVAAVLGVSRTLSVPVVPRGGGTSVAGNAISTGIVIDFSRHMTDILDVDVENATARVQPGVVQQQLQNALKPHGLLFGPDPSTMSRCTIGGMIGNNACGSRSLGYGRTADNVAGLTLTTVDDRVMTLVSGRDARMANSGTAGALLDDLFRHTQANLALIRTEFGTFGRQVSGYAHESLLPERGFDVAKFLVGSEGTLGIVTEAALTLVAAPASRTLVVLGFSTMPEAGDATMSVLAHGPTACEGLDARIVDVVRSRRGPHAVPALPRGRAWLFVELAGDSAGSTLQRSHDLVAALGALDARIITDPGEQAALWRIRADGAGLSGRSSENRPAHAGWEDAAVPPEKLGAYLREFDELLSDFDLAGFPFGHFGEGCLHVRLDFPLNDPGGPSRFGAFLEAASDLVVKYGGSLSGEHGDGRARSAFLPKMYSSGALSLMAEVKHLFDPIGLLNPGVLVDPALPTSDLRAPAAPPLRRNLAFAYAEDHGDFSEAVHRCTGVGKCRADNDQGVMCPSFLATRDEKHSTRGRARVLQEMINGSFIQDGWSSAAVHESLDLCLACKGCASDCPTGVDMATYKAEVLHQTYRGKVRPLTHYSLGWLPRWARLASWAPRLVNGVLSKPGVAKLALRTAGIDTRRSIPSFAGRSFTRYFRDVEGASQRSTVVLFVDTFSNYFTPDVAEAAVQVLRSAGFEPLLLDRTQCCGLTWISTGQLSAARRLVSSTVDALWTYVEQGIPVVGIEPSCTAVLRSDAPELLGSDRARAVAQNTFTLSEFLMRIEWTPPDLRGCEVVAQPHCHHHAVMGWEADRALLAKTGAHVATLSGCCGLAGNFGMEKGHYEVSLAVAEQHLLPAMRAAPDAIVLADGFSCRTQLEDLEGRRAMHLAELLAHPPAAPV